jgi:hypothetical protein
MTLRSFLTGALRAFLWFLLGGLRAVGAVNYWLIWLVVAGVALPTIGFYIAAMIGDLTGWYRMENYMTMQ